MGAPQPFLHSARKTRVHRSVRGLAFVLIAVFGGMLLLSTAHAQSQVSLLTLATDQTPLNLSNHFGVPNTAVVNQAGDYAFIGAGGSALFLRRAGTSTTTRLLQFGDPVPGFAGSSAVDFVLGGLNSSAHLLFAVDFSVSPPDGRLHRAILIYDGTSSYRTVASSDDVAAGSGGQKFGPGLSGSGGLNDHDDVLLITSFEPFAGTDTAINQTTFYIALAGATPVRVVGLGDAITVNGVPSTFTFPGGNSQINALGQFLFAGLTTSVNSWGLFLGSASGVTKVVAAGDLKPGGGTFSPSINLGLNSGKLNNQGQVAFVDPVSTTSTVATAWLYTSGVITRTFAGGSGTTISLSGLSDQGDAVGTVTLTSGQFIVRIHSNGQIVDTIASAGQAAPGVSGATFSSISNLSTDNNDRVIFDAALSTGGYGVYQQTGPGTSLPQAVALEGQSPVPALPGGGTFNLAPGQLLPKALDNGSTFFSAVISGGTANFAEFLGTPGNLQVLMSTADTLPAGARVRLSLPTLGGNNSNNSFAFAANLTGGQTGIFVSDFSGTATRIVNEGDAIPGFGGATFVQRATLTGVKPFYMDGNSGQIVFPAVLTGNVQAILVSDSAGHLTKVAATGDTAPVTGNPTFTGLDFSSNTTALSPINAAGQVGFYGTPSTGVSGIFLYTPGVGLAKIALTGDTVPEGGATFTNLSSNCSPSCSLGINDAGQVAFGAITSIADGLYVGSMFGAPQKVVSSGDTRPGIGGVFGLLDPVSDFNNSGQVVFEPVFGGGVFVGTAGGTITAVALDGATNPGTGGGTLATSTPCFGNCFLITTNAAIDNNGGNSRNIIFRSRVTGGTADSGYFRVSLPTGGSAGPLQAAVLQGQVVPGAGTLGTLFPSFLTNSFFSLGNDSGGDFTFTNSFTNASGTMIGQFLSTANGAVQKLMAPGDAISGTGGGVYSTGTAFSQNGGGGSGLLDVLTAGGTASQAIVLALWNSGTVATSTALVSAPNPSGIGQPAVFTATVSSPQGPPPVGDIVVFLDNGVTIGLSYTDNTGHATFVTASLSAGSHLITAEYFTNSSNNPLATSTSNVVTQVVSNSTSTLLFSSPNPSVGAQSVLFQAFVYSLSSTSSGTPTGSVTFLDNGVQIGTGALGVFTVGTAEATFSTSSLSVGSHSITAQYSGDSNFSANTSSVVTQVVTAAVLTSITVTPNPAASIPAGATEQFTATGHYTDSSTQNLTATATWNSSNTAAAAISNTAGTRGLATGVALGSTNITASLNGVTSLAVGLTVGAAPAITSTNGATFTVGLNGSFTVTTAGNPAPALSKTGALPNNVTFVDNGNGTATLAGTPAAGTTGSYPITITAQNGIGTNATQNFTLTVITPSLTPTSTTLISSLNPSIVSQGITFTATVTATVGGTPTGSVNFLDNGVQIGAGTLNAGGQATFNTPSLSPGSHPITAQYTGGATFAASTSIVTTQQVAGSGASPTALLFGPQAVGTTSDAQTVTVTVTSGAGAATISLISVTGDFAQTNDCGTSVPSGGSCHINVTFTPTATGPRTSQLTVSSSDPNSPFVVFLTGNSALRNLPGFMINPFPRNDDNSTGLIPLGFTANFFGTNYTAAFVNNNGNITFDTLLSAFTPFDLTSTSRAIVAPFFADVDTRGQLSNLVTYGHDTVNGHQAFAVDWINVGYYGARFDKLNTFQVVLIDRSDLGPGDFDSEFNYDKIQWETGDASGGVNGLGGSSARAGYSNGTGLPGTFFELPGSATNGAFLDSNPTTGLIHLNSNSSVPGRILFQVRNGTVVSADLAVTMIHAPNPVTVGGNETFTTTITNHGLADASGVEFTNVLPTGVTFVSATPAQGSCSGTATISCSLGDLANGASTTVTLVVTATTQGTITNTATVSASTGDLNLQNNTGSQTATVNGNPTSTALVVSLNPSPIGQPVLFTAIVVNSSGGVPTGNVTFLDNGVQIGAGALNASGLATLSTTSLSSGSHPITAQYTGDTNFAASTSSVVTQVIQAATLRPSATALASSLNPSITGQSVTFIAPVDGPAGGIPTGSVTFLDNGVQIGTGAINNGQATFSTSSLSAGSHPITAQYTGDADFAASTSNVVTQSVTPNPTSTMLISSLNPSVSTQSVQFSAIVTSSRGGTPTGNVTFFDNGVQIGTGTLNASGLATFSTSSLSGGSHPITAQFIAGANFVGSTSTVLTQTVNINPTSTTLISSLNPSASAQSVQFSATVASSTGATPTGNVAFFDNGVQIGTGALNANGLATFSTSSLGAGSHPITAQYLGAANFGSSLSAVIAQTVNPSFSPTTTPTFIALAISPNPSVIGQSVLITATVISSTSGTPTGNVNFLDNGTSIGTSALNGSGVVTFTTSLLSAGSHPVTAQYFGDANFATSMSALQTQTVGTTNPQVTVQITPIPENVASGTTVQFSATVLNAGTNTAVTWQLTGPGAVSSSGNYSALSTASSTAVVTLVATSVADSSKKATIQFTIAADALTTTQLPATIAAGSQFTAMVQLTGIPPTSTVPFALSCSNLPVGASCIFTPPTVTGTNPNFTVSIVTSGASSGHLAPWQIEPIAPWYALFALIFSALVLVGRSRDVFSNRRSYACSVLVLLCLSVAFLASCSGYSPSSVPVPPTASVTPPGTYQALVMATPQSTTGNNFVQTQLIVPFVVK